MELATVAPVAAAPFAVGDMVYIRAGRHAGRCAIVFDAPHPRILYARLADRRRRGRACVLLFAHQCLRLLNAEQRGALHTLGLYESRTAALAR